jgi:predicted sugar kinase
MRFRPRRPSPALIVAFLALFVAAGSGAAASRWVITSSSQVKSGSIQLSDLSPAARRTLRGRTGAPGVPATKMWALVVDGGSDTAASTPRNSGGVKVAKSTVSGYVQYRVTFPRDVSACSYLATAGADGAIGQSESVAPTVLSAARSSQDARTVAVNPWVHNVDKPGNYLSANASFHLAVFC